MRIVGTRDRAEKIVRNVLVIHVLNACKKALVSERNLLARIEVVGARIGLALFLRHLGQQLAAERLSQHRFLDLAFPGKFGCGIVRRPSHVLTRHHHGVISGEFEVAVQQFLCLCHTLRNANPEHTVDLGGGVHAVPLEQEGMQPASILLLETIHIALREIQFLMIEILQVVVEKLLAQLGIIGQPREVAVLQHDGHLAANFVKICALRAGRVRNGDKGDGERRFAEPRGDHDVIASVG